MSDQLIISLHENASNFFDKVHQKNQEGMQCAKGCSQCCKVDLSIFEIEADRIRNWFNGLDSKEQNQLRGLWSQSSEKAQEGYCEFLYGDSCSVYPARATICRTQGLPLFLEKENILDYCPLNFSENPPEKSDWLNLERLNTMLSMAAASVKRDQRISLKDLKKELRDII